VKTAVCVKHAVDESELRLDATGRPQLSSTPSKMSSFDKNATEEALRLKASLGGSVMIFTLGSEDAKRSTKEALAMGGDSGCLIISESDQHDGLMTSYLLGRAIERFGPFDLILCSEGSSDTYQGQVGPMLSEWLSLPFLGYVRKLEVTAGVLRCEQSLEDRIQILESKMPAVVSVVSEINEPRYPTLIQIMQASKKPIEVINSAQLIDERVPPHSVMTIAMNAQTMSRKRVIFEGTPEETAKKMLDALSTEGVLKR